MINPFRLPLFLILALSLPICAQTLDESIAPLINKAVTTRDTAQALQIIEDARALLADSNADELDSDFAAADIDQAAGKIHLTAWRNDNNKQTAANATKLFQSSIEKYEKAQQLTRLKEQQIVELIFVSQ